MSAPIQPPRAMAVHLVGFLGLPWRIWGYLGSTLFVWGLTVLVFIPVGLLGKVCLILVPFLAAVCLAWPRGGRHMDEWLALAWGYYRAKQRAQKQRGKFLQRATQTTRLLTPAPLASRWDALHPPEKADWRSGSVVDEEAITGEDEPALEDEEHGSWEVLDDPPSAGVFSRHAAHGASGSSFLAHPPSTQLVGQGARRAFLAPVKQTPNTDLFWDEETGAFFDAQGEYLLDGGRRPAGLPSPLHRFQDGRIIPMPQPPSRRWAAGH